MSLKYKSLEEITEQDLQDLITNLVSESKEIEYKEILPIDKLKQEKVKLLAGVTSFANTNGGDFILGIEEDRATGLPTKIPGIAITNLDEETRRLEAIILNGIKPRIPNVQVRPILLSNNNYVLIFRVQKSWIGPHIITFDDISRFYARNAKGNYIMDIQEIRAAFELTGTTAQLIRNFRSTRITDILAGNTPTPLEEGAKLVLHLVPFDAFNLSTRYELAPLFDGQNYFQTTPIVEIGSNKRRNFDGLLSKTVRSHGPQNLTTGYVQVFRNGIIEAADTDILTGMGENKLVPIDALEPRIVRAVGKFLRAQKLLDIESPIFIMLSLLNVKNFYVAPEYGRFFSTDAYPIDKDHLLIPEIEVLDPATDPVKSLQPVFDIIWNSGGWEKSMNYNPDGTWKLQEKLQQL